jgi:phytoene dehydrogenase-like protein
MTNPSISRDRYHCIIIGGGHNGLTCANYLARSGRSVLVLEACERLGGMAITREFAPGFRASVGAHLLNQMPERLIAELALERHGLRWAAQGMSTVALNGASPPLIIAQGTSALGGIDHPGDAQAYREFGGQMRRFAGVLNALLRQTPPRLGTERWADRLSLLKTGWRIRRLGRRDMRQLLRIGGMNAYDLLHEHFQSPLLQGAIGLDAVLGTNLGPRSPGTVMTLLYRLAAQFGAGARGLALPIGGLGAVAEALAAAARQAGAEICTGTPVARVLVQEDRACGVRLASGQEVAATTVISSADPKTSFIGLVGAEHLDAGFVRQVSHLRTQGAAAKLHLALSGLPAFANLPSGAQGSRLLISPTLDYLEHAYNHSKYGEYSQSPALEISVPSVHDASLAPPGQHVLSAVVQYAPYRIEGGWASQRERLVALLIDTIAQYAPGVRSMVLASELLTPEDLEREFRVTGGHWHHEDLALDQFYMVRPVPGAAQYATPLPGFYVCGAGCHPGGGVMGIAGQNAARQVLAEAA